MMPEQLYGKYRQIKSICIDCFKLFLWFSYEREIKASKKDNKRELRSLYWHIIRAFLEPYSQCINHFILS